MSFGHVPQSWFQFSSGLIDPHYGLTFNPPMILYPSSMSLSMLHRFHRYSSWNQVLTVDDSHRNDVIGTSFHRVSSWLSFISLYRMLTVASSSTSVVVVSSWIQRWDLIKSLLQFRVPSGFFEHSLNWFHSSNVRDWIHSTGTLLTFLVGFSVFQPS